MSGLIFFLILGTLVLFGLIKSGIRLLYPFLFCILAEVAGLVLFFWASSGPVSPQDPDFAVNPIAVIASLIVVTAVFGVLLLAVVAIARWASGEYKSRQKEQGS